MSKETNTSGVNRQVPLRFDTAAGVILLDSEGFIGDVFNSVNDLILSGFDDLEEYAVEALHLQNEEARCALRNGVDKMYNKVRDNVGEHLCQWESICREQYLNMTSDARFLSTSENSQKTVVPRDSREAVGTEELQEQEEMLDKELCFLRSQLITAERDAAAMRRGLASMERKLALRSKAIGEMKNLDGAILEEVMESANLLKNKMEKVRSLQRQTWRHQSVPPACSERAVADITEDPELLQLLSRQHSSDVALHREMESSVHHAR